ncbi:hypothetical protein [Parasphingorhabdus halotolerans]|uniref:Uncharacterized protein n=1 Tax=Parasphingorhabdus halotolerans TaxID=2725558 RepID=A0A6H2DR02_9SPHN|nr:hypothetical protein [Parasphingorhabdus halotolerans]QJB70557.1 hypothetical protein HF685_15905 [Parasphingorhabdus halotolerans]
MVFWTLVLAVVLAILLIGQIMATWGDAYLAIADPRPIGGKTIEITILAWGFASRRGRSIQVDDCDGLGINDMRFFMTGKAVLICLVTFGFVRTISIAYRCYAGDSDVGDA